MEKGEKVDIKKDIKSSDKSNSYKDKDLPGIINPEAEAFKKKYFPDVDIDKWNNWKWQLRNSIKDYDTISNFLNLSDKEKSILKESQNPLPISITPYYAHLIEEDDASGPVRRSVIPIFNETLLSPGEEKDPLWEDEQSPAPHIIHRYPDRVLFLATSLCATYCRYCTRSRIVGSRTEVIPSFKRWKLGIEYIRRNKEIRDVLISGGDPLIISDNKLTWLLSRLKDIPHIEFIRIGTKVPVVLPQRITSGFVRMLKDYNPLWLSIHFMHPKELTDEVIQACSRLADAGIPLGSQTVLLKGINDDTGIIKKLMHGLLKLRIRPYYLYQCDPIIGSSHFRTSVETGIGIIKGLQGFTSGYAVPTYVIDAPKGGGKIPIFPDRIVEKKEGELLLQNYKGEIYRYPDK